MTNRLRIYCILTLICLAASCSRVPKHILSERKMRVVLYDMLLAEAMIETMPTFNTNDERSMVYDAVFTKHRITQAEYDSSLVWYGKNMDLYMAIYILVQKDINAALTAMGDIKSNTLSGNVLDGDSIDIWISKRSDVFTPNRVFNTLLFDIVPQNPFAPGSYYELRLSVWGILPVLKHKPKIHLSAVQADTIISVNKEITGDGYYEAVVQTVDTLEVMRIYGYVLMNVGDDFYHRIYLNDIRLMKIKNTSP